MPFSIVSPVATNDAKIYGAKNGFFVLWAEAIHDHPETGVEYSAPWCWNDNFFATYPAVALTGYVCLYVSAQSGLRWNPSTIFASECGKNWQFDAPSGIDCTR